MNYSRGVYFGPNRGGLLDRRVGLFVEGKDDAHFVDGLLENLGADPSETKIVFSGGIDVLYNDVVNIVKSNPYVTRQLMTLGIVIDADSDPDISIQSVTDALCKAGLPKVEHGEIVEYDAGRRLGLFIIPSELCPGAVEDLLLQTLSEDQKFPVIRAAFEQISASAGPLTKPSKRLAQMYLAVCEPLCKGCGIGLKHGHFSSNDAALLPIKNFLSQLACLPPAD